jgi:hypothetical protein
LNPQRAKIVQSDEVEKADEVLKDETKEANS